MLASGSAGRATLLRGAGIPFEVEVSGVDETTGGLDTREAVVELARRKARAVAVGRSHELVIGGDSLLDFEGVSLGKPVDRAEAGDRLRSLAGRDAVLCSGLCVIDCLNHREVAGLATARVRFGHAEEAELSAYLDTGEALELAAGFSIEGRTAPFVEEIEGSHTTVIGLSLPLLRSLIGELGLTMVDLWPAG